MSANAQKFFEIDDISRVNAMSFKVSAGAQQLLVTQFVYDDMKKGGVENYLLAIYDGSKAQCITVVHKDSVQYVVTDVQSIEKKDNGKYLVVMGSGLNYEDTDVAWEKVKLGQHVMYGYVGGETYVIQMYPRTVERNVPITDTFTISPSPVQAILLLDENNRILNRD